MAEDLVYRPEEKNTVPRRPYKLLFRHVDGSTDEMRVVPIYCLEMEGPCADGETL